MIHACALCVLHSRNDAMQILFLSFISFKCCCDSGEVKVVMDPRKHRGQFGEMLDADARTDKTSAALSQTTRAADVLQSVNNRSK